MDMNKVINDIPASIPILLLHGTEDELIPVEDATHYKQCRDSIDLTIIDQARHAFRGKKQSKILLTTTSTWINEKYSRIFPEAGEIQVIMHVFAFPPNADASNLVSLLLR